MTPERRLGCFAASASRVVVILLGAAMTILAVPSALLPCAPAPPPGAYVAITAEDALLVWDPAAGRQHFVRRARFIGNAPDFGFLVPTPGRPELTEAPADVFDRLTSAIQPGLVFRRKYEVCPSFLLCSVLMTRRGPETTGAVRVLEEKRVAGYDAAVLAADDARALDDWLRGKGYSHGPALRQWAEPYVKQGWTITAFKVAGGSETRVGTSAVRMTFATDRPFFPYREPADQRTPGGPERSLRVFVIAPTRMDGALADGKAWPGGLEYASPDVDARRLLEGVMPEGQVPERAWLTAYRDNSSPRPGHSDLFFSASPDGRLFLPPPVEVEWPTALPLPILEGGIVGGIVWAWRRRSLKKAARPRSPA